MIEEYSEDLEIEAADEAEVIDPPEIDSKYRLIILAAQRTKQLQRGAHPRVDLDIRKHKPTVIALKELAERKINFEYVDA
jgi:DNA-directed RNA polymerase subunit omega